MRNTVKQAYRSNYNSHINQCVSRVAVTALTEGPLSQRFEALIVETWGILCFKFCRFIDNRAQRYLRYAMISSVKLHSVLSVWSLHYAILMC